MGSAIATLMHSESRRHGCARADETASRAYVAPINVGPTVSRKRQASANHSFTTDQQSLVSEILHPCHAPDIRGHVYTE
jgi:hypothetical protein